MSNESCDEASKVKILTDAFSSIIWKRLNSKLYILSYARKENMLIEFQQENSVTYIFIFWTAD